MSEEKEPIFLFNNKVLGWERPLPEGCLRFSYSLDGRTTLTQYLDTESINENVGLYRVEASAVKYLADIILLGDDDYLFDAGQPFSNEEQKQVLFSGGITVYKGGEIPGTSLQGHDLVGTHKLWATTDPTEDYMHSGGLKKLIIGERSDLSEAVARIESILKGYEVQEENDRRRQQKRDNESWRQGESSGRWNQRHGY